MIATKVIAIASPPGGGKSTLSQQLAKNLKADVVFYDDYQRATQQPIEDILHWMSQGSNYNALDIPHFDSAIQEKKRSTLSQWLIVETPLGRHHHASGQHIDCLIWLDTPLDVSLARNILAFSQEFKRSPEQSVQQLNWLENYIKGYLETIRTTLPIQRDRLKPNADIVLDGTLTIEMLTQIGLEEIALWGRRNKQK